MTDIIIAHLREIVNDQKHFTARWLRDLKTRTGAEPETAAMVGAAIYGICLLQADQAQFLANGLLIAVPILLTYIYPRERPSTALLLIYWACLSIFTIFDRVFAEALPIYYIIKVCAIAALFLRPISGAQKILDLLEKNKLVPPGDANCGHDEADHAPFNAEELRELEKSKSKKSPPPEKPEGENKPGSATTTAPAAKVLPARSVKTAPTQSDRSVRTKKQEVVTPPPTPVPTPTPVPEVVKKAVQEDSSRQTKQSLYLPAPNEGGNASKPASTSKTSLYLAAPNEVPGITPVAKTSPKTPTAAKKQEDSSRQTRQSLYLPAPGESSGTPSKSYAPVKTPTTKKPVPEDSSRQTKQSLYLPAPIEGGNALLANSPKPSAALTGASKNPATSLYLPAPGESSSNPMLNDANYRLTSSASNTSTESVEGDKNPDDLIFTPTKKIIFNSPFDDRAITYHMTVKNNCRKWIAYAIKSNAIPRVTAMPPSGVLKPGEKHVVAVTIQKFKIDDIDVSKDRIAFDYVFCPPDTKAFTHSLLQGTATRRRKNIKIEYNP